MSNQQTYNVAVVGATGAVGRKMLETLEKRQFPINELKLLSSKRSAGKTLTYNNQTYTVEEATPESFEGIDIALFSAGGGVSKKFAPEAVKRGAVVVDNTSAYRMDGNVPLVVPEVNEADIKDHKGIIANPNCSTIQMVAALQPLKAKYGLKRIIVSTYQAVSGSGAEAIEELKTQTEDFLNGDDMKAELLPVKGEDKHYPIAFNALPQIDVFTDNGYTFEEMKMINETKKIMHDETINVAATCVRLPVFTSHAESVYVELDDTPSVEEIKTLLASSDGVTLQDKPEEQIYPTPLAAAGLPDVFVGRIRKDLNQENGYHMWIVSDNLLKGAAWNSVQIAESLVKNHWL
ncbi:aspartate-semialdehyde dehydrogenase [Halolactibacillus miurensis]|uniref:Aspartate-semialdehyde dehydrogenase n=1 Tax=Halolactibacillus miurensis TaxID=306541 RepID=A0A1I6QGP8_9BACI|nr:MULTISPECIES: aspartate-semialdehyde dehydrogenase [Halolactibacillus]GEM03384.1 aspartate-semialdehyde dehydrogenase [Halolactibacillus miurensis]SFS51505.1 aspartate-semialdehyde dehydrogenase [Halolactibacillus miurensis]